MIVLWSSISLACVKPHYIENSSEIVSIEGGKGDFFSVSFPVEYLGKPFRSAILFYSINTSFKSISHHSLIPDRRDDLIYLDVVAPRRVNAKATISITWEGLCDSYATIYLRYPNIDTLEDYLDRADA